MAVNIDEGGNCYVNFNQDFTSLSVGYKNAYTLYSLNSVDQQLEEIYSNFGDDICLVERLFSSSLLAIVSMNAPRKLKVCHFKKGTEICNYSYSNTIKTVKLNRARLVVCLEESLYIHNIRDMKVVHTIRDTPINSNGLCALAADSDNCYLAYPGSAVSGELQIFDAVNLNAKTMIPAHDSPLAAMAFSLNGSEIATASEKGTVIRVFSVNDGVKLYEFRRGVKRCVSISSLSFSTCKQYLCCSSNTETVHIFKLEKTTGTTAATSERAGTVNQYAIGQKSSDENWMGYLKSTVASYLPYALPTQVTDVFTQGRAFASAMLPISGIKHACAITTIQKSLRLLVASQNGYMYIYSIPLDGGECQLIKKHDLKNIDQNSSKEQQQSSRQPPNEPSAPINITEN
ncbi:hypothetical protein PVAND_009532 [Polypedilum vanderplanki]|uniref:WD repeat domain phosphoinositide-interacting protein 2 n=1 Tax=Polypedilum vanderplanki TaxID=319348 RepID=A0A9J6CDG9_POLVA|nr:hypothetical protein PVAND_009532 [Polypedilum vanderplanki]